MRCFVRMPPDNADSAEDIPVTQEDLERLRGVHALSTRKGRFLHELTLEQVHAYAKRATTLRSAASCARACPR